MTMLFVDFDNEAINDGFQKGEEFAHSFYNTYIKDKYNNDVDQADSNDEILNSQNQTLN